MFLSQDAFCDFFCGKGKGKEDKVKVDSSLKERKDKRRNCREGDSSRLNIKEGKSVKVKVGSRIKGIQLLSNP